MYNFRRHASNFAITAEKNQAHIAEGYLLSIVSWKKRSTSSAEVAKIDHLGSPEQLRKFSRKRGSFTGIPTTLKSDEEHKYFGQMPYQLAKLFWTEQRQISGQGFLELYQQLAWNLNPLLLG